MNILIVNPNTTASMTDKMGRVAAAIAGPGVTVRAVNPSDGPVSIEGYVDEAFSVPGLLATIRDEPAADAYVLACFDDTGLDAARCVAPGPVIGMALLFLAWPWLQRLHERLGAVADTLLANFGLLFVPAGVGVMLHIGLIALWWAPLLAGIVVSSAVTMVSAAWLFQWLRRRGGA